MIETYGAPITRPVPRDTWAPWLDADSDKSELMHDWECEIDGVPYVVPAGYITDWASIPQPLWVLWPPHSTEVRQAALLHDYCYSHLWPVISKKEADALFARLMEHDGAPLLRRWLMYLGVRLGGKGGWHRIDYDNDPFWRAQYEKMVA